MGKIGMFFAIFTAPLLVGCELNGSQQSIEAVEDVKAFSSMVECLEYVDVCASYPPLGADQPFVGTTRDGRQFECAKVETRSKEAVYRATISNGAAEHIECFDGFN